MELIKPIPNIKLERVSRSVNGKGDKLAKLAKKLADPDLEETQVTIQNRRVLSLCLDDEELQNKHPGREETLTTYEDDWMEPFFSLNA